jgi:hypothetical protein
MIEDIALKPETYGRPAPEPALTVGQPLADRELIISERCYREAKRDFPGAGEVIFTMTDEATGEEVWDTSPATIGQGTTGQITEAAKWRKIMGWPIDPTVAEALAWQANANARAAAKLWFSLLPDAPIEQRDGRATDPPGRK